MKEKSSLSFFWKSTILTFALLMNITLGYNLFLGEQSFFVWRSLHERHDGLIIDLDAANEKKANISQQIRALQNDASYMEKLIRQRLNYVRENEVLYIFENVEEEYSPWTDKDENIAINKEVIRN